MSPKKYYTFMIEPALEVALKAAKDAVGRPEGEILREALTEWLGRHGIQVSPPAITDEIRAALRQLADAVHAAQRHGEVDDVTVPAALEKACGGGKRLGALTEKQRTSLSELFARNARAEAAPLVAKAARVKRER